MLDLAITRIPAGVLGGQVAIDPAVIAKSHAIYATRRVVGGYSGNAVRLLRESDSAEQDFAFQASGVLDSTAINSFRGASTLRVTTLYDQSGKGLHLTPPAATSRPGFKLGGCGNWLVCFNDYANFPILAGVEHLQNTGGSIANRNLHVIQCGKWNNQNDTQPHAGPASYQIGFAANTDFIDYSGETRINTVSPVRARFVQRTIFVGGSSRTMNTTKSAYFVNTRTGLSITKSTPSGLTHRFPGYFAASVAAGTDRTGLSGIRWGCCFGTSFRSVASGCFFMVSTALSNEEESSVATVCADQFGAVIAPTAQVVVEGDSISAGNNMGLYDDRDIAWPMLMAVDLGPSVLVRNQSISSAHFAATAEGGPAGLAIAEQAPDKTDPLLDSTFFAAGKQLLVIWAGTNDIHFRSTTDGGVTVHNRLSSYCTARRTAGWKVLVVGPIPRGPFDANKAAELIAYNNLISANWSTYADGYINMMNQDWTPGGSYATNYLSDQIHPNATGRAKANAIIRPVVQSML